MQGLATQPVLSTLVVRGAHLHAALAGATLHASTLLYISGTCLYAASLLPLMSDQAMGSEGAGPQGLESVPMNAPISEVLAVQAQVGALSSFVPLIPGFLEPATVPPVPRTTAIPATVPPVPHITAISATVPPVPHTTAVRWWWLAVQHEGGGEISNVDFCALTDADAAGISINLSS